METYYPPTVYKESFKDKVGIYLNKKGPYIASFIIKLVYGLIVSVVKFLKHLVITAINTFRGKEDNNYYQ